MPVLDAVGASTPLVGTADLHVHSGTVTERDREREPTEQVIIVIVFRKSERES